MRQIVYVNFTDNYSDTLSRFGLGLLDAEIRERLLARASEVFAGIGVEYRTTPPMDYALFSQIDVLGIDPNGLGLMGYDNSPGKDVGNVRLYDRIGGVHASYWVLMVQAPMYAKASVSGMARCMA